MVEACGWVAIDRKGWFLLRFRLQLTADWAVGLIDFTGGAMVPPPEDAASKQRWRSGI